MKNAIQRITSIHRLLLGWVFVAISLSAQAQVTNPSQSATHWHLRYDLFQMLLEHEGLKPTSNLDSAFQDPRASVLVATGKIDIQTWPMQLFLEQGGAVLIASDSDVIGHGLFRISAGPISTQDAANKYLNFSDCIRVKDFDDSHATMLGVKELIVNRSGWINNIAKENKNWISLARLPVDRPSNFDHGPTIVAVRENDDGWGRIMLAADHSLFINGMMWHADNAIFAVNVARWLRGAGRKQILFVADGIVLDSYLLGPIASELPIPLTNAASPADLTMDQKIKIANALVQTAQSKESFNSSLTSIAKSVPERSFRRILLQFLAIVLALYGLYLLFARTLRPTLIRAASIMLPAFQMHRWTSDQKTEQLQALRTLAKDLCIHATASDEPRIWFEQLADSKPWAELGLPRVSPRDISDILSLAENRQMPFLTNDKVLEMGRLIIDLKSHLVARSKNEVGLSLISTR